MHMSSRLANQIHPTYLFYDLETTGKSCTFDQIIQFAAVRVDHQFQEIERCNIRIALNRDVIPNPQALLVNRTTVEQLAEGVSEYDAIHKIYDMMNQPGTTSIGYNSIKFDDKFLRFSFFRNLLPPYRHQYANSCHRMDIFPMMILAHQFQPDLFQWPVVNGKISFKLEELVKANQLSRGQSHDALVDVLDTIELAKILHRNTPFWNEATAFFDKQQDIARIGQCETTYRLGDSSYQLGFMMDNEPSQPFFPALCLGVHKVYANQSRWLRLDNVVLRDATPENVLQQPKIVRKKQAEPPFFFPFNDVRCTAQLTDHAKAIVEDNLQWLSENPDQFSALKKYRLEDKYPNHTNCDASAALYQISFPTTQEESLLRKFHLISTDRKYEVMSHFKNPVYRELAIRIMGRNMPNILSSDDKLIYYRYLNRARSPHQDEPITDFQGVKKLSIVDALNETNSLLQLKTEPHQQAFLHALKAWYQTRKLVIPEPDAEDKAASTACATPLPASFLPPFTAADFARLCENEYYRYMPNSDVISHVLVKNDTSGADTPAMQFKLPDNHTNLDAPLVGHLSEITRFSLPNDKVTLAGMMDATPMISRRSYAIDISQGDSAPDSYTLFPLSPKKNPVTQEDRPIIYDTAKVARFRDTPEARATVSSLPRVTKSSPALVIKNEDLTKRMAEPRRPDQNTVMGRAHDAKNHVDLRRQREESILAHPVRRGSRSAVVEMAEFHDKYSSILTDEMNQILSESIRAPLNSSEDGQARPEWLHRHSHNLHDMQTDPQRADNLGSAQKRFNTEMMIPERTVQHFALKVPSSKNNIKCAFKMLLDSELIDEIDFAVIIQIAAFKIKITQHIDVFQKNPQCVRASDLASLVNILYLLMQHTTPLSLQPIRMGRVDASIIRFPGNFFQRKNEDEDACGTALVRNETMIGPYL